MSRRKIYITILLPILLAISFLFVGCGNSYMGLATRWLANGQLESTFFEETTYTAKPYTATNKDGLQFELASGGVKQTIQGMTTAISNPLINQGIATQQNGYALISQTNITGKFSYNGQDYAINDSILSRSFIRYSSSGFRPIVSEQVIQSTTPVYDFQTKKYNIVQYDYTVLKYYDGDSNSVQITITPSEGSTTIEKSTNTYYNLAKNNVPIDNTELYFMARAMRDNINIFNTITSSGIVQTQINLSTGTENLKDLPSATDTTEKSYATTSTAISIAGTGIGKGPGRRLTFISYDSFNHALYRIQEIMPYNLGDITYTLSTITTTKAPTPAPTP